MGKLFLRVLMFIMLSILVNRAYSQDDRWVYFSEDTDTKMYFDNKTIQFNEYGTKYVLWIKWEYKTPKLDKRVNKYFDKALHKLELYCKANKLIYKYSIIYYEDGSSYEDYPNLLQEIIPNSIGESLQNKICN